MKVILKKYDLAIHRSFIILVSLRVSASRQHEQGGKSQAIIKATLEISITPR
jgi:hypothetical protein